MSLYIGHLSSRIHRDELERVFGRFGRCNIRLKDGFGFVIYDFPPNAQKALRALQGRNICGEPLTLSWSNKQPRPFKRFAKVDRFHDYEPPRGRDSARGEDYGNRKSDLNGFQDYKVAGRQFEIDGRRLNSADSLNEEAEYHRDHINAYIKEEHHDYREGLENEVEHVEPNPIDNDRWDGRCHDLSNGNAVENDMEFDRYDPYKGYDRRDEDENHQPAYSGGPRAGSSQEKSLRVLNGEEPLNHNNDSKFQQACYNCGGLGHKMRNCPHENASRRKFTRFDSMYDDDISRRDRKDRQKRLASRSQGKLQLDRDNVLMRGVKNNRNASGSGKHGGLLWSEGSHVAKGTDKSWRKDYPGKKRSRRGNETPKRNIAKKARTLQSSPHHSSYTVPKLHSKSKSLKHLPGSVLHSRSRSMSSSEHSPSSLSRSLSISHYTRSKSSKSSSRSSSPISLSLSVPLGKPLTSSPTKEKLKMEGIVVNSTTLESKGNVAQKGQPVDGDGELEDTELELEAVNNKNAVSSAKAEEDADEDESKQRGNKGNHVISRSMLEVTNPSTHLSEKEMLATESLSPLALEDRAVTAKKPDSELPVSFHPCRSTSISSEELYTVMKHYGLQLPDENERDLPVNEYFGSARLWPWEIIYYSRLKKGPISTENYAMRVAQNKEFGIIDKYIRSSSGWGEQDHP